MSKMVTWNGKHGKGAMRNHRNRKRLDAAARNAAYQKRGRIPADPRYRPGFSTVTDAERLADEACE
jgi:hypothetical protein